MPIGALPIGDVTLAQKVALATCEREVRAMAMLTVWRRQACRGAFGGQRSRPFRPQYWL